MGAVPDRLGQPSPPSTATGGSRDRLGVMIGALLAYTKSLGACIIAHAVTNLLLAATCCAGRTGRSGDRRGTGNLPVFFFSGKSRASRPCHVRVMMAACQESPAQSRRGRTEAANQLPKCNAPMGKVTFTSVVVDRCASCRGLWFDAREHERLKDMKGSRGNRPKPPKGTKSAATKQKTRDVAQFRREDRLPRLPHADDPDGGPPPAPHPLRILHRLPRRLLRRGGFQLKEVTVAEWFRRRR